MYLSEKISFIICGRFHYHHYISHILESNQLEKIYFSHRLGSLSEIPPQFRRNHPLKEYLINAHILLFKSRRLEFWQRIYHAVWNISVIRGFSPSKMNLFLLQGACAPLVKKAKGAGGIVIGEAVNLHPTTLASILATEAITLGVPYKTSAVIARRKIQEIADTNYIIAPSTAVANSYIENGYSRNRIFVLPYGIADFHSEQTRKSTAKIKPISNTETIRILTVAQVTPRKGLHYLLEAINQLELQGRVIELEIVGRADIEYIALLRALRPNFKHYPRMHHDHVMEKMRRCDIFALTSIEDGFGTVITEAISVGTPVIVSQHAGASELISRAGGGIVVDPRKVSELAEAVINIIHGRYRPLCPELIWSWRQYAHSLLDVTRIICEKLPDVELQQNQYTPRGDENG